MLRWALLLISVCTSAGSPAVGGEESDLGRARDLSRLLLYSPKAEVRLEAVRALRLLGPAVRQVTIELVFALTDEHAMVRFYAADTIGRLARSLDRGSRARMQHYAKRDLLASAHSDPVWIVARKSAIALKELGVVDDPRTPLGAWQPSTPTVAVLRRPRASGALHEDLHPYGLNRSSYIAMVYPDMLGVSPNAVEDKAPAIAPRPDVFDLRYLGEETARLEALAHSGSPREQAGAIDVLAMRLPAERLARIVAPLAVSPSPLVRGRALSILWRFGRDGQTAGALAIAVRSRRAVAHRVELIDRIQPDDVFGPALLPALSSAVSEPAVTDATLRMLLRVRLSDDDLLETMAQAGKSERRIAEILRSSRLGEATQQLRQAIAAESDPESRARLVGLVGGFLQRREDLLPAVAHFAQSDPALAVRRQAAVALAEYGPVNDKARDVLLGILTGDDDVELRLEVAEILQKTPGLSAASQRTLDRLYNRLLTERAEQLLESMIDEQQALRQRIYNEQVQTILGLDEPRRN
ncbi:MAG: HEAT repeat domain-containing protein [Planctomycetes bacterium]|nr:HEAT repeat domain-containing protein [Planctomycetota bacterium]